MGNTPPTPNTESFQSVAKDTSRTLPYHPRIKKECMQSLIANFPEALSTSETFEKINFAVMSIGCQPKDTLFASSICADEINHHS